MADNVEFFRNTTRPDWILAFRSKSRLEVACDWLAEWLGLGAPLAFIAACYALGYWAAGWPAVIGYTLGGAICLPIAIWLRR